MQSFGRIDDKTRIKKLEQIDYELLKVVCCGNATTVDFDPAINCSAAID